MYAGSVNFAMIEGFGPNQLSIEQLRMAARNNRGVQAHAGRVDEDTVAAFLVGAGEFHYYGMGGWQDGFVRSKHWVEGVFGRRLGEPDDAVYDQSTATWTRTFKGGTKVTFDTKGNKGAVVWGK